MTKPIDYTPITLEQLKDAMPNKFKTYATDDMLHKLNACVSDPDEAEQIKKNFLSYTTVLESGKYQAVDYLNAVMYCTYKLMGFTNLECYKKAFPARYARLVAKQTSSGDIAAYVAAYNRNKLVNTIMEQAMIPTWVLNQDVYQEAINTQADLMRHSESDKVRAMAADSILNHLKRPENIAPTINIDMRENSGLEELKKLLTETAQKQKDLIDAGVSVQEVAEAKVV